MFKIAVIVSLVAILGKFVGFAREAIIAAYYGANAATDAFFFAQAMPTMIFPAVCNSISTAFLSIYVSKKVQDGPFAGEIFASKAFSAALILSIGLSALAVFLAPYIVPIMAPGFDHPTMLLAIKLTKLVTGTFVLTMLVYMFSAVLNANKYFYVVQVAGLLCNLSIIILTLFMGKGQSIEILTLTVIIGYFIQVLTLLYWTQRNKHISNLMNPFDSEIKTIFVLALPILLGNSVVQIQTIVDKALVSNLEQGSIAILSYSATLNNFVTSVIITSLSTVLYPILAENASSNKMTEFHRNLSQSLVAMILVLLPISIITFLFAHDIVAIVFKRGKFDSLATIKTSLVLSSYAMMYVFIGVREVLIRSFYAIKDTKTPMRNAAIAVFSQVACSLLLVPRIGIVGVPIGATVSSIIASIMLVYSAKQNIEGFTFFDFRPSLIKIIIAGGITLFLLIILKREVSLVPILNFIIASIICFISYWTILLLIKSREAIYFTKAIKNKIKNYYNKIWG